MKAGHVAPDPLHLLAAAFAAGLTQGDMLEAAAKHYGAASEDLQQRAINRYDLAVGPDRDDIEIDASALTSEADNGGTWVMAWLRVPKEDKADDDQS